MKKITDRLRDVARAVTNQETGWDWYSRFWKCTVGQDRRFLGDEWTIPSEAGAACPPEQWVERIVETKLKPVLQSPGTILEIGSGGGRWTSALLPFCRSLVATDISGEMMKRLKYRFKNESKLRYQKLTRSALDGITDASIDFVFSYGVFVHLNPWQIFNYIKESRRILRPGGRGLIHLSNTMSELGWDSFTSSLPACLDRPKPFFMFGVMCPELLAKFLKEAKLHILSVDDQTAPRDLIVSFEKPLL